MRQRRRRRTTGGVREKGKEHWSPHCSFFVLQPKYKSCCSKSPLKQTSYTSAFKHARVLLIITACSSLRAHGWKSTYNTRAVLIFIPDLMHLWPQLGLLLQLQHSTKSQRHHLIRQEHWINQRCTRNPVCGQAKEKKTGSIINLHTKHKPVFYLTENTGYCLWFASSQLKVALTELQVSETRNKATG